MAPITKLNAGDLADAIYILGRNGLPAALQQYPELQPHRLQLALLHEAEQDVTELEGLLARAAARVEEAEAALRRAVLEEVA